MKHATYPDRRSVTTWLTGGRLRQQRDVAAITKEENQKGNYPRDSHSHTLGGGRDKSRQLHLP